MTEYAYPECTTSVITALSVFKKYHHNYRTAEIEDTTRKAIRYLHDAQRPEGGWFGSWGICFTYATMFALESLSLVGESYRTSERVKRACDFLVGKQKEDGGWGESYKVNGPARPHTPRLVFFDSDFLLPSDLICCQVLRARYLCSARAIPGRADGVGGIGAHVRRISDTRTSRAGCAPRDGQTAGGEP